VAPPEHDASRQDESEDDDDRRSRQTKANEPVFARGHIAFGHNPLPQNLDQGRILRAGVAKITQGDNKQKASPPSGETRT
jgi:hypothetical protein